MAQEHNPEIDWHTGDIHMTRCPAACRPTMEPDSPINSDWLKNKSAEKMKAHPEAKSSD